MTARVTGESERVTFTSVLRVGEFRTMWLAELFSVIGDQIARVALTVLVFNETSSATLTGLTYALTFVPAMLGGILFAGLGDRFPRRDVMIATDVGRAVLVGLMILPGTPLWLLCVLVGAMTLLNGPFKAAQQALLPDVLAGKKYMVGMAIRNMSSQAGQLLGFAGGGLLVSAAGAATGLAVNAGTFVVSALLLLLVRQRKVAVTGDKRPSFFASTTTGARIVWRDPALRTLVALNWLAGFYVVAEALAVPFADGIGAGAVAVGLLMAADPFGSVIGAVVFGRWVPEQVQVKVIGVLGILAGVPLAFVVLQPGLIAALVLFALSGMMATGYNIQGTVSFVRRLPDSSRAQCSGLNSTGLITVQGLGALAAGALADVTGTANAIAAAGVAGVIVAVPIALSWSKVRHNDPVPQAA
ncbi:MFS transporter [Haloechinothrix halophila]|uniref:MFS transporter n=1 Tax=Haloechinothrix halophila TaxID=1069073 RepID=UPI00040CCC81|nr:MFS transporter [Haloechinothrix halophila]